MKDPAAPHRWQARGGTLHRGHPYWGCPGTTTPFS